MHRHGYQGRKLHRETDQRQALIKGLAEQLIIHGKIETTLEKAKEVQPYLEKLITKAKTGSLHGRRQIIAKLNTIASVNRLVDEIAPQLSNRSSGYLRIVKSRSRRGDNAQLAVISFVDELTNEPAPAPAISPAPVSENPPVEQKNTEAKTPSAKKKVAHE
jgi:large subunit ribosomal protein L17